MKTCPRCKAEHDSRWKLCDSCREKQRVHSARWREEHYQSRPRKRTRQTDEDRRAKRREWYQRNREREQARAREWAQRNPAKVREWKRRLYVERRSDPAWVVAERARLRLKQHARTASQKSTGASFSPESLLARLSMYARCWICREAPPTHVDHVKPLSKGGPHILANLRPACSACNLRKGSKWPFPALRSG